MKWLERIGLVSKAKYDRLLDLVEAEQAEGDDWHRQYDLAADRANKAEVKCKDLEGKVKALRTAKAVWDVLETLKNHAKTRLAYINGD